MCINNTHKIVKFYCARLCTVQKISTCILNTHCSIKNIVKSRGISKFLYFLFGGQMKKFNDCRNVIGNTIKKYRELRNLTKIELSHKLELLGIELDRFELYKIETAKTSVKDFELIGLCIVLDIDFEELKKIVENYG